MFSVILVSNPTTGGGGGVMEPLPRVFDMWKAFDLLNKMRYILRVEARFEACDDTNSGRQSKSLVIARTSLYGGSLHRGSTV